MKLLVINGPNLNMLGIREPAIYGSGTYAQLLDIILNPAAYTHTSVALLDALKAVAIPTVEVHISDVAAREDFRQISYVRPACIATVTGRGFAGYLDAMDILLKGAAES